MNRATPSSIRMLAAALLVGCLVFPTGLAQAQAESVSLSGRIFQADGSTPYANVTVRVMDQETGMVVATTTTGNDGSYSMEGLQPGTYSFEVEVPEGIYQLDRAVSLGSAESASISFTVKPTAGAAAAPAGEAAAAAGMSKKKKGGLIAVIVVGAILVGGILKALDDDDDDSGASPFTP